MFGNHPLSFEATGTHESLARISREHLLELKHKVLVPENLTIVVVGDYNKAKWLTAIKALEKSLEKHNKPRPIHKMEDLTANKRKFLASTKEQSHVIMGWRALSLSDPDRFTLHAIEAILAGQGGRLFLELRDKNSLAYSVSPMRMESLETGYFGGYIACSHEKVNKALEMFEAEFQKLCTEKVGAEELERAKKYLIGQHDIGLQKKSALCNLIAFDETYGNDYRQSLHIAEEYNKITEEKIMALAKRLFMQPHVISIVGKENI